MTRFYAKPLGCLQADWYFPMTEDAEPSEFTPDEIPQIQTWVSDALGGERVEWKDVAWRRMGFQQDLYMNREGEFGLQHGDDYEISWVATATLGDREVVFSCTL